MRQPCTLWPPRLKRGEIEASFTKRPPGVESDDPVCVDSPTSLELSQRLLSSPPEDIISTVTREAIPLQLLLYRVDRTSGPPEPIRRYGRMIVPTAIAFPPR
jgi:hypothetical protein